MVKTRKPIYNIIIVFNLLLIVAAFALTAISILSEGATVIRIISLIIRALCLMFAGLYLVLGFSKDGAKYFKLFGFIFMLSVGMEILTCILDAPNVVDIILNALVIICILALVFTKNLGKARSFIICGVILALEIACAVLVYLEGGPFIVKIDAFIGIDLACLLGIMTFAKYLDKAERNAK